MDTPCDAMLLAAMTNLLMGESATSNLLMGTTRAPSRSRRTASTSTSQALDRSFSAFEYATECATSEASNTVFTAQTSFAVLQALQNLLRRRCSRVRPSLPPWRTGRSSSLNIANALTRARQRLRESSSTDGGDGLGRRRHSRRVRVKAWAASPRPSCNLSEAVSERKTPVSVF